MTQDPAIRPRIHLTRMGIALVIGAFITPFGYFMTERAWLRCRKQLRSFARLPP